MSIGALLIPQRTKLPGGQIETPPAAGTYTFIIPDEVYSICAVCVGSGGIMAWYYDSYRDEKVYTSSANGGNLRYKNNIPVSPGDTATMYVGGGGYGSVLQINGVSVCSAAGGNSTIDATPNLGDGGGNGGIGPPLLYSTLGIGYGGAAGYSGNGGDGVPAAPYGVDLTLLPTPIFGGGGGGGSQSATNRSGLLNYLMVAGGGVGLKGEGPSATIIGGGGSGGGNSSGIYSEANIPGLYGGGGHNSIGGIRIIWGPGRRYPSTLTFDYF